MVFTQGFLKDFGNDPDVLATTLGHELAHHNLGHTDPGRQQNRANIQDIIGQVLSTITNYFVPFSSPIVGTVMKTANLSINRDDARGADILCMRWTIKKPNTHTVEAIDWPNALAKWAREQI